MLGAHSLLTLDGDRHLAQRKMMLPPFHGDAIARYRKRIAQITTTEMATWPTDGQLPIRDRMKDMTFEVILQAIIGVSDPRAAEAAASAIAEAARFQRARHVVGMAVPKSAEQPDRTPAPSDAGTARGRPPALRGGRRASC